MTPKQKQQADARARAKAAAQPVPSTPQAYQVPQINVPRDLHEAARLIQTELEKIAATTAQLSAELASIQEQLGEMPPPGAGGVQTINGEAPDAAGDVALSAGDVGAMPITGGIATGPLESEGRVRGTGNGWDWGVVGLEARAINSAPPSVAFHSPAPNESVFVGYLRMTGADTFELWRSSEGYASLYVNELRAAGNCWTGPNLQVGSNGNANLNVGDTDSGLASVSDGVIGFRASNALRGQWDSNNFHWFGSLIVNGTPTFNAGDFIQKVGWYDNGAGQDYNPTLRAEAGGFAMVQALKHVRGSHVEYGLNVEGGGGTGYFTFHQNGQFYTSGGALTKDSPRYEFLHENSPQMLALHMRLLSVEASAALLRNEIYTELLQAGILTPTQHSSLMERSTNSN